MNEAEVLLNALVDRTAVALVTNAKLLLAVLGLVLVWTWLPGNRERRR